MEINDNRQNAEAFKRKNGLYRVNSPFKEKREKEYRFDFGRRVLAGFAFVFAFLAGLIFYLNNYPYSTYEIVSEYKNGLENESRIYSYLQGILVLSPESLSYIIDGETIWTEPVDMKEPCLSMRGEYISLYDYETYRLFTFDEQGTLGTVKVSREILNSDTSIAGVSAILTGLDESYYISYFDRYANRIDVEVKMTLSLNGCPVDIAVSPDGQKLAVVCCYLSNGIPESRLYVYDFKNGKSDSAYLLGCVDDYAENDTFVISCKFTDNSHIYVTGDGRFDIVTLTDKKSLRTESIYYPGEVKSVPDFGDKFCFVTKADMLQRKNITSGNENATDTLLYIYNTAGELQECFCIPDSYEEIITDGMHIVIRDENRIYYYNVSGSLRYSGTYSENIDEMEFSGKSGLCLRLSDRIEKIILK